MLISAVERTKAGRYSVFADGEFLFSLHPDIYFTSQIEPGAELSEEQLMEIKYLSDEKSAIQKALRLLSDRSYTALGMYEKLVPSFGDEASASAVLRMKELCLIDDLDYARRYLSDLTRIKGYSLIRAVHELRKRGIDSEIEEQVVSELGEDYNENSLRVLLRGKYRAMIFDRASKDKAVRTLMRMGYSCADILRAIRELECE